MAKIFVTNEKANWNKIPPVFFSTKTASLGRKQTQQISWWCSKQKLDCCNYFQSDRWHVEWMATEQQSTMASSIQPTLQKVQMISLHFNCIRIEMNIISSDVCSGELYSAKASVSGRCCVSLSVCGCVCSAWHVVVVTQWMGNERWSGDHTITRKGVSATAKNMHKTYK